MTASHLFYFPFYLHFWEADTTNILFVCWFFDIICSCIGKSPSNLCLYHSKMRQWIFNESITHLKLTNVGLPLVEILPFPVHFLAVRYYRHLQPYHYLIYCIHNKDPQQNMQVVHTHTPHVKRQKAMQCWCWSALMNVVSWSSHLSHCTLSSKAD